MFEELEKTEDMFAETDATAPQVSAPTQAMPAPASVSTPMSSSAPVQERMQSLASVRRPFPWKAIILFIAIIAVITIAFILSMRILKSKTPITPLAPESSGSQQGQGLPRVEAGTQPIKEEPKTIVPEQNSAEQQVPAVAPTPVVPSPDATLDSDKDGLTDVREAQLGTNPNNPDTDGDGLTDREEVDVYHTNPLNPDTDGDGYKDGDEVKKGYDPNGPGKLLVIPK